jgi:hypothetical protein
MEPYEREFYISRICAGYLKYKIDSELSIYIHALDLDQQYEANELFKESHNEALMSEIITNEECREMLIERELWSEEEEESLEKLGKDIEELKVQLYNASFKNDLKHSIRKGIKRAKNKFLELAQKRATYDFLTCKGYATFCRYNWMLENVTKYKDGTLYDWEHVDLNQALSFYHTQQLNDDQLREIAKTEPWKSVWSSSKKNGTIFNRCGVELTEEQRSLIAWSSMYDNVYESMECPTDDVIEDDDSLDGWLIIQRRKREQEQKKLSAENVIGNSKINNADEVFIMTDPSSTKDIDGLNNPVAQSTKKARLKDIKRREKAGKKFTKHSNLKDVKQRINMEANQKYSKTLKGR